MGVILNHETATIESSIPRLPNGDIDMTKIQPLSFARAGDEDFLGEVKEGVIRIGSGDNITPVGNDGILRYRNTTTVDEIIGAGDAVETEFSKTLINTPVIKINAIKVGSLPLNNLEISVTGIITADGLDETQANNINFETGFITITFISPPGTGVEVAINYQGTIKGVVEQSDGTRWLEFRKGLSEVDYIAGALVFGD